MKYVSCFSFTAFIYILFVPLAARGKNIVVILSDDHRYDFMSFMEESPEFLETPNLDRLATEGAHLANAFVTTSLCSPSRASILTGQYMRNHRVVDNQRPVPPGTMFFPEYLQDAGYQTGYVGKWHMGHEDDTPRKGFDHWVSFAGQGTYFDPTFNINGKRKSFKGYNADLLTDQAISWLNQVSKPNKKKKPFFLQIGYKAVHYPFQPPPRHAERYSDKKIDYPETMANTEENYQTQSNWIRERRYGIHGIDHMQTGALDKDPVPDFDELYHNFCETVHALDENIGRVLNQLDKLKLTEDTLVIYLGDNGFALGEHGFYDKRDAFEESIRIPMLARHPKLIKPGARIENMTLNVDIAPTILEYAGVALPANPKMDGDSFLSLLQGKKPKHKWRDHFVYEYHWEWNFPATPTTLAIRTDKEKYVFYHGVWDRNGFYDLNSDPHERHNLIHVPAYQERILELREKLFNELDSTSGLSLPIRRPKNEQFYDRKLRR
ncbi:sulfatase family protein [Candidatus Seribacter sulfatis]|jgi:N-acetylglucosamine-6-sulfatase|uniref:sulfatase family protein n=1 Tax=Candidatus Seribacter sulfatis TaxID=3381756 RepID=UPI00389AF997